MSSYRQAQAVVQSGHPKGWGRVLNLPTQTYKKGLGFVDGRNMSTTAPLKVQGVTPPIQFVSGGVIHEEAHAMSEERDNDFEMDKQVRPTISGKELANWFFEDVIEVTCYEE